MGRDGWDGLDGMDGMDGMGDGWDGLDGMGWDTTPVQWTQPLSMAPWLHGSMAPWVADWFGQKSHCAGQGSTGQGRMTIYGYSPWSRRAIALDRGRVHWTEPIPSHPTGQNSPIPSHPLGREGLDYWSAGQD